MTAESSSDSPVQNQNHTKYAWSTATFVGIGYLKPGPGTWASIAGVLLWLAEGAFNHLAPRTELVGLLFWIALAITLGVPAATIVEHECGRVDPGFVVIDEVIGQWIALLFSPVDWQHGLIAWILFRWFDIT